MKTNPRSHDCPRCGAMLDEGPILFRCAVCCRSLYAADLDTEFRTHRSTSSR
ncbi:hypothetical protein Ssi03_45010 [Sphaerisporangium siamense]|uniref:Uncharacterized protein n=1 Tax=Sphaerisporangium siamense TaxID=795645 RepID=A0A7W7DGK5_9ACTN|nr:hypothetical protein [Sphaerisporangium siamense]MBB4705336.1 hypothetical protein [Sphaerisporangium siamense]GII86511.1 hypothetical protein Ssi03_45010 [Sphaerisporangium siamense]